MFNKLISSHIQDLKKLGDDNAIFVYKGFPINFYKEILKYYPSLNNNNIFIDDKLNLFAIKNSVKDLISNFLNKNGIYSLTYEELITIAEKVNDLSIRGGKIIIIQNNLFDEYPNQSNINFIDLEEKIEKNELNFKENEVFNSFYSNSAIREGINYIQYRDIDLENNSHSIILKNFFDLKNYNSDLDYTEIENTTNLSNYISFPNSDSYWDFRYRLFENEKLQSKQILVTNSVALRNNNYKNELIILQSLFKQNDLDLKVLIKKNVLNKEYRNDVLKILKKYWRSPKFRELIFYSNPLNESCLRSPRWTGIFRCRFFLPRLSGRCYARHF